jgi:hypothetical protein
MPTQRLDDNFVIHRDARLMVIVSSKYHHTSHFGPKILSIERHNVFGFVIHRQAQHLRSCVVSHDVEIKLCSNNFSMVCKAYQKVYSKNHMIVMFWSQYRFVEVAAAILTILDCHKHT